MKSLDFTIKKQYLEYTNSKWKRYRLHKFQQIFLEDKLKDVNIVSAPTGAGKTFGFGLLLNKEVKKQKLLRENKLLIVSPTKILCQQICNDIKDMYGENVDSDILNSDRLNTIGQKGYERWKDILKILLDAQVVVATPDIVNFIITSGYQHYGNIDFTKTTETFIDFISKFSHIIIDEFHLYNEEQIANILVWHHTFDIFTKSKKKAKLIFVSATPTVWLEKYLDKESIPYRRITVEVRADNKNARTIHGELKVSIIPVDDVKRRGLFDLIKGYDLINKWAIGRGEKLLCLYNSLKALHVDRKLFNKVYANRLKIQEISGFDKSYQKRNVLEDADVILGTSAIEQGVNIKVANAVILAGFTPRSLIQRFGRIARGDYKGRVLIVTPVEIFRKFGDIHEETDIDEFYRMVYEAYGFLIEDTKQINKFMGAFWFVIVNEQNHHVLKPKLIELVHHTRNTRLKQVYNLLYSIKKDINSINSRNIVKKELSLFFSNFLKTFQYFRESSVESVHVYEKDLMIASDYPYDWIVRNKEIIGEKDDGTLIVVDKTEDNPVALKYEVSSLPFQDGLPIQLENYEFRKNPKTTFIKALDEYFCNRSIARRDKKFNDRATEIFDKLKALIAIINSKRFLVERVKILENTPNII